MYRRCLRAFPGSGYLQNNSPATTTTPNREYHQHHHNNSNRGSGGYRRYGEYVIAGGAVTGVVVVSSKTDGCFGDNEPEDEEFDIEEVSATRYRKTRMFRHFCSFSSIKYQTELFMTGDDFLRAILSKDTRISTTRKNPLQELTEEEYQGILDDAPTHNRETRGLFRSLGAGAVISYPEFLFLVSILSKPRDHFLKTFQMIDCDSNWVLTKDEFEIVERLFSKGIVEDSPLNTTLKVHFFKMDGSGVITFEDFVHFLDGLQKECLEVEFNEYSRGRSKISDSDFTELLLSRTTLGDIDRDIYLKRVEKRHDEAEEEGVTFCQYSQFMNLLNDIHDLEIALRMFQIAKKPVTPEEFQRAVRVTTGTPLDIRLVKLTFKIFDDDGDGQLSHGEFMKVMKDRIRNRGTVDFQITPKSWIAFRKCVHERMILSSQ